MNNAKLSIIIPVYNGEKYIKEAIDSVIKQDDQNYELIIVDDGSTDSTCAICDAYGSNTIKVFHQANSGVSTARNQGIELAVGEYILFLDSDDTFTNDAFKNIRMMINNEDILLGLKCRKVYPSSEEIITNYKGIDLKAMPINALKIILVSSNDNLGVWACWRHIYKRAFLVQNKITFDHNYSFGEDMDFIFNCINLANSFGFYDQYFINYRLHDYQVSHIYSKKHAISNIEVLGKWLIINENNIDIRMRLANKMIAIIPHLYNLNISDQMEVIDSFNKYQYLMKYSSGKFKVVYNLVRLVGYPTIIKLFKKKKR